VRHGLLRPVHRYPDGQVPRHHPPVRDRQQHHPVRRGPGDL